MHELGREVDHLKDIMPVLVSKAGGHPEGTSFKCWHLEGNIVHVLGWKVGTWKGTSCMSWARRWTPEGHHACAGLEGGHLEGDIMRKLGWKVGGHQEGDIVHELGCKVGTWRPACMG